MFTFNHLRRRVLISHSHGRLRVKITAVNERSTAVLSLVWVTGLTALFFYVFVPPIIRLKLSGAVWFLALIPAAVVVVDLLVLRMTVWQAFGVDDIVVERGTLHWSAKALWLKQEAEFPVRDISEVSAVTSWFSTDNHVEITVEARRYLVGNRLLIEETTELADALKRAAGLR